MNKNRPKPCKVLEQHETGLSEALGLAQFIDS